MTTRVRDDAGYAKDNHKWWVLGVIVVGTFMSILDSTVVNIALPKFMSVFSADVHQVQWVLTGYLLALAMVIPLTGYVDETFGGKRVYMITVALFTIASALCGLSWSLSTLIFFRVLQGLGGGLIQPLGMSLLLREFRPEDRGTALGFFGIPIMLAPAVGPILGGYLVEYVDWRFIFYINVPIGIFAVIAASRILHDAPLRLGQKLDTWGIGLVSVGSAALLLGVDNGPTDGWGSSWVMAELVVGIVCLVAFVVVELQSEHPLLELRLFRRRNFSTAIFVTLIVQIGLFGGMFLVPVFVENLQGLGAMQTGLLWLPQSLAVAMIMPLSGRIFDRFGPVVVLVPGLSILVIAMYLLSFLSLSTTQMQIVGMLLLRGIGMGFAMMPATTAAMNATPRELIPRASALASALQRIAGSFGAAIMATMLTTRENFQFNSLAQSVTTLDPGVRIAMAQAQAIMRQHNLSAAAAHQLTALLLFQNVTIAATVRGFDDTFYFGALLCIPAVFVALLVRNTRGEGGRGPLPGAE